LQVSILLAGLAIFSLEAGAFSPSLFPSLRQNQRASMASFKGGSMFAPSFGIRQNVASHAQARKTAFPVSMAVDLSTAKPEDMRVLVAGCTGYIGRFVTKELIKRGYKVVAFSREKSGVGGKKSMDVRKTIISFSLAKFVFLPQLIVHGGMSAKVSFPSGGETGFQWSGRAFWRCHEHGTVEVNCLQGILLLSKPSHFLSKQLENSILV
jgi:hypothetical protein